MKAYAKNDKYRPVVTIKKNVPSVLEVEGRRYILDHENHFKR